MRTEEKTGRALFRVARSDPKDRDISFELIYLKRRERGGYSERTTKGEARQLAEQSKRYSSPLNEAETDQEV